MNSNQTWSLHWVARNLVSVIPGAPSGRGRWISPETYPVYLVAIKPRSHILRASFKSGNSATSGPSLEHGDRCPGWGFWHQNAQPPPSGIARTCLQPLASSCHRETPSSLTSDSLPTTAPRLVNDLSEEFVNGQL